MPSQPVADRLNQSIQRGVMFIGQQQAADGGFVSHASRTADVFKPEWSWSTNFVPSLILGCLAEVGSQESLSIRGKIAGYLQVQRGENGAFNYWSNRSSQRRHKPYPDDLDDTFCALSALYRHDESLVDEKVLAQLVKLLLATEIAVGGPYATWLAPTDSAAVWRDVDLAVNANIAYFFRLLGQQLPNITSLLGDATDSGKLNSPYYPSAFPIVYYIARVLTADQPKLLATIKQLHNPTGLNSLNEALCVTALCRLQDYRGLRPAISRLLKAQRPDGSWPAEAFYIEPSLGGKPRYGGADSLTTAIVCEALQLCLSHQGVPVKAQVGGQAQTSAALKERVLRQAKQQLKTVPGEVRQTVVDLLQTQLNSSSGLEIISLPQLVASDLSPKVQIDQLTLANLALANLYGWLAYTVYDDFMDDEGHPHQLPAANVALRLSLQAFYQALPDDRFQTLVRNTFNIIDDANAWELAHCRWAVHGHTIRFGQLPDYGERRQLANRSLGHTLPALAAVWLAGGRDDPQQMANLSVAMTNYLIVRQLNDDLHDWAEDLDKGHISYVLSSLLDQPDTTGKKAWQTTELIANLRKTFWQTTLLQVCEVMRGHLALARQALQKVTMLQSVNSVGHLLDKQESVINETVQQQAKTKRFLRYYGQSAGTEIRDVKS